jgi:hypothetical protein
MPRQQSSGKSLHQAKQPVLVKQPLPFVSARTTNSGPSFGQTMKEGFSFGIGNAIAHNVISRLFGSTANAVHPSTSSDLTNSQNSTDPVVQTARSIGASATQDMSGQIDYLQCRKEGGTEDSCKQYLV